METLADILTLLAPRALMTVRTESRGPFSLSFRPYEHVKLVAVIRGAFHLQIVGEAAPISLRQGDCYMLPHGRAYQIFNAEVGTVDAASWFADHWDADGVVRWGGAPPDTITVGCRPTVSPEGAAWARSNLPPAIHMPAGDDEANRFREVLHLLRGEPASAFGSSVAAHRYVDLLLVQALRHCLANRPWNQPSWLAESAPPAL
jgi:hypothetical protein